MSFPTRVDPRVDVVTWQRQLPAWLEPDLRGWVAGHRAESDRVLPVGRLSLARATRGLGERARRWIETDISAMVDGFARLTNATRLRVSFGAVRTDQCRKLHVDYVRYRLVTTYLGPGTEWVPEDGVCRAALEDPPECPDEANAAIAPDAGAIRHATPGDVILMKGALHAEGRGAVHRSPPIEARGLVRVVLIVTTVDAS